MSSLPTTPTKKHFEKGVSLLESMVSMLIFLIGVMGWLSLEMAISAESLNTQARSQAVNIANSTADFLKQLPYDTLADAVNPLYFDETGLETDAPSVFEVSWSVVEMPAEAPEYKAVAVEVLWTSRKDNVQSVIDLNFEVAP